MQYTQFGSFKEQQGRNVLHHKWFSLCDLGVGLVLSSIFINLLSLAFPIVLLQVYDRVIPNNAINTLVLLVVGLGIALLLETLLKFLRAWSSAWSDARIEYITSCRTFQKIVTSKFKNITQIGTGVQLEKFNALHALKDFYGAKAMISFLDFPFVLLFLGLILYVGHSLVLVPLFFLLLFIALTLSIANKLETHLLNQRDVSERRMNFIIEVLRGIHTVKSFGLEAQMLRRYERLQTQSADNHCQFALITSSNSRISLFITQANMLATISYGALLVLDGNLSLGQLVACVLLSGRMIGPINKVIGIWIRFKFINVAKKTLKGLDDIEDECDVEATTIKNIKGNITLCDVNLQVPEQSDFILKNINLSIKAGEAISINSEGLTDKSQLLSIIGGLQCPTSGEVLIEGQDLYKQNIREYRKCVAYLPQKGVLFEGSILENITLFREGPYLQQALEIAHEIGLNDSIEHMPDGYFTCVGAATVNTIPKGLVQQIAIARALLEKPPIVLFDEANSALDIKNDAVLLKMLLRLKGNCTLILVTQRPSVQKIADNCYQLINGELVPKKLLK